mmetsp:Transcript_5199/g.6032  ORF Transcript_5199/g.6032 Transcript_5199/m.6032 type:complete len:374 (-) Transcript_5199:1383-2504(-)|eukprot:CAMPEP_0184021642 /NCGR_PEP_ID=MMETSP0954-20121128/10063_1 /TAXON_ID=627963 /ORGANISM="Aplanochytrium sp, Strain PBS07" /LENGTH=373 /DNA_ID=CAMNT_0026303727 /DNA_START=396 /DNA_END=1517 /DNA_ORIENTATION=-
MSTDEDWDTSVNELPADKFNSYAKESSEEKKVTPPKQLIPPVEVAKPEPVVSKKVEEVTKKIESVKVSSNSEPKPSIEKIVPGISHGQSKAHKAFTEELDPEALAFFNDLTEKKFSEQAVAFLNAYWEEVGDQAEFIFSVAWEVLKYADMHTKGVNYVHLYQEGNLLDFNVGLYFYEKLCKKVLDDAEGKKWRDDPVYAKSLPTMQTAIVRKKELREKVDVNFDGRISFLEYLLYQYQDFANPKDFTHRSMKYDQAEHPEITKARMALQKVNEAIAEYEAEKSRLEELAAKPGVKGIGAKHQLAILHASPLAENLNKSLITAEAAVRIAIRKFKGKVGGDDPASAESHKPTQGSLWWLKRDLEEKQKLYGRKK